MPLHSVELHGGFVRRSLEKSPVVALETDAETEEGLPAEIRAAADSVTVGAIAGLRERETPRGADGVVTWLTGDRILSGSVASMRHDLRVAGR